MNSGFGYLDIILLAMIAGFIILRLRGILGRRTGHEKKALGDLFSKKVTQKDTEKKIVNLSSSKLDDEAKEEFIKELLDGLTTPPGYFPKNVLMNIQGYESFEKVKHNAENPLTPDEFEAVANASQALILDTRNANDFAKAFIPNSINIGLDGNYAPWVGELIKDIDQEILLVTDEGKHEEAITRLARVGYDHAIGYLKGGMESWIYAEKEVDTATRISAEELETIFKEKSAVLIDVRKKSEYDAEHVEGSLNIPLNTLNEHLAEIPKEKPFVVFCAGGYRSMIASSILKQRGYDNFKDVVGGFNAIKKTDVKTTDYVCPSTLL